MAFVKLDSPTVVQSDVAEMPDASQDPPTGLVDAREGSQPSEREDSQPSEVAWRTARFIRVDLPKLLWRYAGMVEANASLYALMSYGRPTR